MSEEEFLAWLMSLPGKTTQQKLNYMQDALGMAGVDLFGAKQEPFIPEVAPVNQIEAVWGNDPGMAAIMDFIQIDKMSPKAAVDKARELGEIPQYNAAVKGEVDYLDLASQFAAEEAKRSQFEVQQATDFAKHQAGSKPGLRDMFATPYEQMGSPSVDDLMAIYAKDRERYLGKYSSSKKTTLEQPGPVKGNVKDKKTGFDVEHVARAAAGTLGQKAAGLFDLLRIGNPVGNSYLYAKSSEMIPKKAEPAVPKMNVVEDKAKAARNEQQVKNRKEVDALVRRNLENRIALNQRGRVATPQGEQVMRNLALLGVLGG